MIHEERVFWHDDGNVNFMSESGICRGNEYSGGNENLKLRKNIFSEGKNRQAFFLSMKIKMRDL